MRLFKNAVIAAVLFVGVSGAALADDSFPNRPIQIVNPYQAGSTTDILARGLAAGMSTRLGQQLVVVNKPGAGGSVGTASVARATPDGYTLLFAPALVVSVLPQARPPSEVGYEPSELIPICQTFSNVMGVIVRQDSPFKNVGDLVKAARAKEGALTYGHQGVSTIPQLAIEEFLDTAKLKVTGVPYRGDPAVMTDLLGGRIDFAAVVLGVVSSQGQNVRLLGVFDGERHPSFPDVPTVAEQGFNVAPASFGGLLVRKGTPAPVVAKLAAACDGAAHDEFYRQAAKRAAQPVKYYGGPEAFGKRLQQDVETKARLLKQLGQAAPK